MKKNTVRPCLEYLRSFQFVREERNESSEQIRCIWRSTHTKDTAAVETLFPLLLEMLQQMANVVEKS